jgi:adenosylcobinamide-GDP ribazoletransferase
MKKELHIFFTALMFYTRIPCPKNIDHNPDYLNKASRYFPLVGWIVGTVAFGAYCLFDYLIGPEIGVLLSMIASILVTGAFHEDGFADVCDGFGGGWTKEKILTIMKDSAIGAYGAIGVVLLLLVKLMSVNMLLRITDVSTLNTYITYFLVFVSVHALSRLAAVSIVFTHEFPVKMLPVKVNRLPKVILGAK